MSNRYIIITSTRLGALMEKMEEYHVEQLGSMACTNGTYAQAFTGELLRSKLAAATLAKEPVKPVTPKPPAKPKAPSKAKAKQVKTKSKATAKQSAAKPKGPFMPKETKA